MDWPNIEALGDERYSPETLLLAVEEEPEPEPRAERPLWLLAALPPRLRDVIDLRAKGAPWTVVAAVGGVSRRGARYRLASAQRRVQRMMTHPPFTVAEVEQLAAQLCERLGTHGTDHGQRSRAAEPPLRAPMVILGCELLTGATQTAIAQKHACSQPYVSLARRLITIALSVANDLSPLEQRAKLAFEARAQKPRG